MFDYKRLEYGYDANGNLVETKDQSTGAKLDTYRMSYTSMNQVAKVEDISKGVVKNKREFEYDRNGNIDSQEDPLTRSMFYYDTMNQVEQLANRETGTKEYQWTKYERTPNGQLSKVTKPNEMTTSYTYYLDALLKEMETKKKDGTTIQKHALEYNANGHRTKDTYTGIDADKKAFNYIYSYQYDPRDRLVEYNKTGTSSSKEQYVLDANSNIVSKTKDGVATNYQYDKDRLISETTSGKTKKYEYDSIGRVSQIKADDVTQEEYKYDVFDNIKEHQKLSQKTQYEYDAQDRTIAKTESAGTSSAKKIKYNYLGTGGQVISEEVDGIINRSYTYSAWGERLSMTKKMAQGSETSYYLNNTDVDVEMLLDEQGEVRATYGYSPYGENDEALFSGVDKPDPKDPKKEIYNPYRYTNKPWDPNTQSYDLGFRNYFPGVGRFLTPDSYNDAEKYKGLLMDAANYNMYRYTNGNPVSAYDDDGHVERGMDGEYIIISPTLGTMRAVGYSAPGVDGTYKWNKKRKSWNKTKDEYGNKIKKSKNPTKQRTQHPPKVKSMNRKLWDQTTEV
ncbi:RHS repeat-associated protein, partial [Croceifilum oryzae]